MNLTQAYACGVAFAFAAVCPAAEFTSGGRKFVVPEGFVVERVAGPPLVQHPVHAAFDDQGRLLVTDVSGSNAPLKEQLRQLPHRIVRLTDTRHDGVFDRATIWADKLPLPEGILWHEGAAYVAAPPAIWKLKASADDSRADAKTPWFDAKTLTGCGNDLHGPWLGPDGWIYWTKGAFAEQRHELTNGKSFTTRASMLLRRRVEGGPVDVLMTGGMDNPVGLAFLPGGERIISATFLHHPAGGLRDGMIHALYGGVYGKDHDAIDGLVRTGELLPVMTECGPAAPSAVIRYEGNGFGAGYRDNLLLCQFNLRKVSRHIVHPVGATFRTEDSDWLSSPDLDFHPTDVIQDVDGSVLVIDTGGWYKLCCPTSQLAKPEIPGAIYRVRRRDAPKITDPRGLKLEWSKATDQELVDRLADKRLIVAAKAVAAVAKRGPSVVPALKKLATRVEAPAAAVRAIWALTRINRSDASPALQSALSSPLGDVRRAASHALSIRRDPDASAALIPLLWSQDRGDVRAAAEALGRGAKGDPEAPYRLLEATAGATNDRALQHALVYALWELDDAEKTVAAALKMKTTAAEAAALWVGAQDSRRLHSSESLQRAFDACKLLSLAENPDADLRTAARFAMLHLPNAETAGIPWLKNRLLGKPRSDVGWDSLRPLVVGWIDRADMQSVCTQWLASTDRGVRLFTLSAMAEQRGKTLPAEWIEPASKKIAEGDAEELGAILALLRKTPSEDAKLAAALRLRARDGKLPDETRLSLLAAAPGAELDEETFAGLRAALAPDGSYVRRGAAAEILGRSLLSAAQLDKLAAALVRCGPLEIERLLPAFTAKPTPNVGRNLIAALKSAKSRKALRVDDLRQRLKAFGPSLAPAADELYMLFAADHAAEGERLQRLLTTLPAGDGKRGLLVFNSAKASCRACHRLGYVGGELGPDLSRIGSIRARRDLLESIVFPSASFVRSYEPTLLRLTDGRSINGLVRWETVDELVLAINAQQEQRIAKRDVEGRQVGTVSIMPAGLDQQLTPQELADLVAFLQSAK